MRINGSFDTRHSRQHVYARLSDPPWLVPALDFPAPRPGPDGDYVIHGDVGIGPAHGAMEVHVRITESQPDQRAAYTGWGSGLGSTVSLEASFQLSDASGGGTHVEWTGEADLEGPVVSIASNIFQPLSKRNFEHLQHALDAEAPESPGQ